MTDKPTDLRAAVDAWLGALHEDAHGLVWTTKAEIRAALLPPGDEPVYAVTERDVRILEDIEGQLGSRYDDQWAVGSVLLPDLDELRAMLRRLRS